MEATTTPAPALACEFPSTRFGLTCLGSRWRAFGIQLHPFTVGHAILLDAIGSPFGGGPSAFTIQNPNPADALLAMWICSREWQQAANNLGSGSTRRTIMVWRVAAALLPRRWQAGLSVFARYLDEALSLPQMWQSEDGAKGKTRGCPARLAVILKLTADIGMTWREAMGTPMALASWLICADSERNGGASIVSDKEAVRIAMMEARDAGKR